MRLWRVFLARGWPPTPSSLLLNSRTFYGVFLLKALSLRLLCRFLLNIKASRVKMRPACFVAYVSGLLTLVLALVTVAGMLAAPWVITITAPGFADTPEKFALTTQLLRITFPYILLISLASLVGAILNTWNRFSVPAFAPTFLNVSMIGFALFAAPYFNPPMLAMAWAVTVGGILQLAWQLPHLKKSACWCCRGSTLKMLARCGW
jgi:peptidoglycan biosynthesis protein MviN/MurJ (putative lipid II flippase)